MVNAVTNIFKRIFYRKVFILFAILANHLSAGAEVWKQGGLFRADSTSGIFIASKPTFAIQNSSETPPADSLFKDIYNPIKLRTFVFALGTDPFWMNLSLVNSGKETRNIALRFPHHGVSTSVFLQDAGKNFTVYHPYKKNGFLYVNLALTPGFHQMYVRHQQYWSKMYFGVDIVDQHEIENDRGEYMNIASDAVFTIVAFAVLILFQIVYVALQMYFHRKPEYFQYLLYLLCIGLYFEIRMEMIVKLDGLVALIPWAIPYLNDTLLLLPFTYYLGFSRYFIGTKELFPKMDKIIKTIERLNLMMAGIVVLIMFLGLTAIAYPVVMSTVVATFFISLWLIRFFYLRRNKLTQFLLLASIFAITGHFLAMTIPMFPSISSKLNIDPINLTMAGLAFEMFIFNTGLGYKAKHEQEEKIKAQTELIGQYKKNQEIQEQMQGMRDKIANDLHDDIGSTLSGIVVYGQVAINSDKAKADGILLKIIDSSQRMMESMRDIVWAIHSRNDEGRGMVKRMRDAASDRLGLTGIKFTLDADNEVESRHFTMAARRNMLMLFKEALNNAVKHSGANAITCRLQIEGERMLMEISDNGKGFDTGTQSSGNGLGSMHQRSAELKARLYVESSPEQGTRIRIQIPLAENMIPGHS